MKKTAYFIKLSTFHFLFILSLLCLHWNVAKAQKDTVELTNFQKTNKTTIKYTPHPIKIDGKLDDTAWIDAPYIDSFWRKYPDDLSRAKTKTNIKLMFDDQNLYFGFYVYDTVKPFIQSLKRDVGHDGNDCVAVILDPLNKHLNGFFFVVSAHNTQSEDQINSDGDDGINFTWDGKWHSETKIYKDHWEAEMSIPFKTLRYQPKGRLWGINFLRVDPNQNEYAVWTHLPLNFPSYDLGYTGALYWPKDPPTIKKNFVINPYILGSYLKQPDDNGNTNEGFTSNIGLDAKLSVSSNLNVDLTVNPDFSQIEIDNQVTNLTRFSIFYPEKRTFFQENSDLFSSFGIPPIRPFYTRTIGLVPFGSGLVPVPIYLGARLTGSLSPKTRIGIMNIQTGPQSAYDYEPENFTAITFKQQVLKRSQIKGYFLNKESFLTKEQEALNPMNRFGRNLGTEFNYSNPSGTVNAWAAYHLSIKPALNYDNAFAETGFALNFKRFGMVTDFATLGTNYFTDMGFVQRINNYDANADTTVRLGFKHYFQNFSYRFIPKNATKIVWYQLEFESYNVFNDANFKQNKSYTNYAGIEFKNEQLNESNNSLFFSINFQSTSRFSYNLNYNFVNLLFPTSFTGKDPIPVTQYYYSTHQLRYFSDFRKNVSFNFGASYGGFYNGIITSASGGINWRVVPYFNLNFRAEYNKLDFPENYGSTELVLLTSNINVNFSTKVFWNTLIQYNNQNNTFNWNLRLQYRFKPLSDLFFVYTDNYYANNFSNNISRAIVVKFNYWFNL